MLTVSVKTKLDLFRSSAVFKFDNIPGIKGVGAKTAKRIIIELKDKFIKIGDDNLGFKDDISPKLYDDALNAGQKDIEVTSISSFNTKKQEVDSRYVNLKFITKNEDLRSKSIRHMCRPH